MKNLFVTIFFIFLPFIFIDHSLAYEYVPVNINDPKVIEMAKFAVKRNNEKFGDMYEFSRVISGRSIDLRPMGNGNGITYDLNIIVVLGRPEQKFQVVVVDWLPPRPRFLAIFKEIP
ncbi:hypothetical protein L2E82_25923 [Cichorium intybus]|uniref:Uncharacterized protein n=1 Tax=Cichorium intybus TaxID=13427 RepID=A0ACB9E4L9_CICIN|nr:hypothetical protein L1887_25472 [Cichorium endivia]KAI3753859.1 hypothetical protein L2E82_25923 [Cichorium intybus]